MPPRKAAPVSLSEVVAAGDRKASLEALRDTVAKAVEVADAANVASLAKQLQAVLKELAELPPPVEESNPVDDLNARRAARRATSQAGDVAGGGGVVRRRRGRGAGGNGGAAAG